MAFRLVKVLVLVVALVTAGRAQCGPDCATAVREAVLRAALPSAASGGLPDYMQQEVAFLLKTQSNDGSWPDVDYNDPGGRSWWRSGVHLRRLVVSGAAFAYDKSPFAGSPAVRDMMTKGLEFWYEKDPPNLNWWWEQLGTPRSLARALILLGEAGNSSLVFGAAKFFDRAPLAWAAKETGCNRVWGASVNVLRGALEGDGDRIQAAYNISHSAVAMGDSKGDGVQVDGSFHQHGPQLYSGWGYGAIFTTNVLSQELFAVDDRAASLRLPEDRWAVLTRMVLDGQQVMTRGPNFDFEASGRLMTYFVNRSFAFGPLSHYHSYAAFTPFEIAFRRFQEPMTTPLAVVFQPLLAGLTHRSRGQELADYGLRVVGGAAPPLPPLNRHFFTSDYMAHSRPSFLATSRLFSNRTINSECVNSENKRGKDLADGALVVYRSGREFEGVFPVWDWQRVPGTTEHRVDVGDECSSIQRVQHTSFVGGVSDGSLGGTAMYFRRGRADLLQAFKTTAMLDDAAAAFGAAITSAGPLVVGTSLDQRNLNGSVVYATASRPGTPVALPDGDGNGTTAALVAMAWAWHGGLLYVPLPVPAGLAGPSFNISSEVQTGSLALITQGPDDPIARRVFSLSAHHGTPGAGAPAAYLHAIAPLDDVSDAADAAARFAQRVSAAGGKGWGDAQTVCDRGAAGAGPSMVSVFWPEGDNSTAVPGGASTAGGAGLGCWDVTSDTAALVQVRRGASGIVVAVSNPLQFARPLSATVTVAGVSGSGPGCAPGADGASTSVTVRFPSGNAAGNSTVIECAV